MIALLPRRATWRGPDADRSQYGTGSPRRRSVAMGATVALHLAVGTLLLNHLAGNEDKTTQASSGRELSVFSVPNGGAANTPDPENLFRIRVVTKTVLPQPTMVEPAMPTIATVSGTIPTAARQGARVSDPFAAAALTGATTGHDDIAPEIPIVRSTVADLDTNVLLTAPWPLQKIFPDRRGTAILRCLISADGRVIGASFLGGSIDESVGVRLAQALVRRPLYPTTAPGKMRTALLGPFSIPLTAERPS